MGPQEAGGVGCLASWAQELAPCYRSTPSGCGASAGWLWHQIGLLGSPVNLPHTRFLFQGWNLFALRAKQKLPLYGKKEMSEILIT